MKRILKAALLAGCAATSAMSVGPATTYSKLVWHASFVSAPFAPCGQIIFDATGDLASSDTLLLAGRLNCPTGSFGLTGSLYMGPTGALNITMIIAGYTVSCPNVFGWVGTCTVFDAAGNIRSSGVIQLL